jgi:hypothetical protein
VGAGRNRLTARRVALGVAIIAVLGATANATLDADPGPVRRSRAQAVGAGASRVPRRTEGAAVGVDRASAPCGQASASVIAGVDAIAAQGIYAGELHGTEVKLDVAHITGSRALLSALAMNNEAAVRAAVHAIVYAPRWHIVRLRVTRAGHVLADVGGPHVIAPVSGELRWRHRIVASYVMSVQDDAGFVKLVGRFIGVPVDLYANGSFLMGTLHPAPASMRTGASASVGGASYVAQVFSARAFSSDALRVALLVRRPTAKVAAESCAAVRLSAWGAIATRIAGLFKPNLPSHYAELVALLQSVTGGRAYVRTASTQIAGGAGPSRIPPRGSLRYAGRVWSVLSWEPVPRTRVYLLTPYVLAPYA